MNRQQQQKSPTSSGMLVTGPSTKNGEQKLNQTNQVAVSPTPRAALARIPSQSPRRGRKSSVQPNSSAMRYQKDNSTSGLGLQYHNNSSQKKLAVQGNQKEITDRSQNSQVLNDIISMRLLHQQILASEGTQAAFESMSDYGNRFLNNQTEPLSPLTPMRPAVAADLNIREQPISPNNVAGQYKGLLESRSSVLIPEVVSSRDSKNPDGDGNQAAQKLDRTKGDATYPAPTTTDMKVEVLRNTKSSNFDSPQSLQKMKSGIAHQSFIQRNGNLRDSGGRRQKSLTLLKSLGNSPNNKHENSSPVIITSLEKQNPNSSIIFDVRSETPTSTHRKTPVIGGDHDAATVLKNTSVVNSEARGYDESQSQLEIVQMSRPIVSPSKQAKELVNSDLTEVSNQDKNYQTAKNSSNYMGMNTYSISLFGEESNFKNPNASSSPFRQSNNWRTSKAIMANLEHAATFGTDSFRGDGSAQDKEMRKLFRQVIMQHETSQKKKWKNMTPYERAKVFETFMRIQRVNERNARSQKDAIDPTGLKADLSLCINVGEIKPSVNPHIKLAEQKGFGAKGARDTKTVKFSNDMISDPQKIIQTVLELQRQNAAMQSSTELARSSRDGFVQTDVQVMARQPSDQQELRSMTHSQMKEELQLVRNQQEQLLKEFGADLALISKEPSSLGVTPNPSVLHSRYPYLASDLNISDERQIQQVVSLLRQQSQTSVISNGKKSNEETSVNSDLQKEQVFVRHANPPQSMQPSVQAVASRNKVLQDNTTTLKLDVVPEEIQQKQLQLRMTTNSLKDRIKETIQADNVKKASPRDSQSPQQNGPKVALSARLDAKSRPANIDVAAQMSLQAISLTKKHQMETQKSLEIVDMRLPSDVSIRGGEANSNSSQLASKQQNVRIVLGTTPLMGTEEQLQHRYGEDDEGVEQLAPSVNPSKLNMHKVVASHNSRCINHNDLDNITQFIQANTAKGEHRELESLENRLREYQGTSKIESAHNESAVSERNSKMTHLYEPRLPKNPTKTKVTAAAEVATSKTTIVHSAHSNQQMAKSPRLGMVVGTSVARPTRQVYPGADQRTSSMTIKTSGGVALDRDENKRSKMTAREHHPNLDLIEVSKTITTKVPQKQPQNSVVHQQIVNVPSKQSPQQQQAQENEFRMTHASLHEKQSVTTNRIESQINMRSEHKPMEEGIKIMGTEHVHVGASYTFYNNKDDGLAIGSANGEDANDGSVDGVLRVKATSEMIASPERSQEDRQEDDACNQADFSSLASPVHPTKPDESKLKPIPAETPIKHHRATRGTFHIEKDPKLKFGQKKLTSGGKGQLSSSSPDRDVTMDDIQKSHQIFNDSGFKRTANFATQMNKSTGLPATSAKNSTKLLKVRDADATKHSYATTIQFGANASVQPQVYQPSIMIRKGGAARSSGAYQVALSHRLSQSAKDSTFAPDAAQNTEKVFIDKRAPKGHQLMLNETQSKTSFTAANLGFALSPLARRGQQVIALGARHSRKQIAQTKTPLSKLLTATEMIEFQKALANGKSSKVVDRVSPGEFFNQGLPNRELTLNQVSTSRIIPDVNDHNKASKIDLKSSISGHESPPMSPRSTQMGPIMVSLMEPVAQQWEPLKLVKPSFLRLTAESDQPEQKQNYLDNESNGDQSSPAPLANLSARKKQPMHIVRNETADIGATRYKQTGKMWHGSTMRSTRYLNDSRLDEVRLVGVAATINVSENPSKAVLSGIGTGSKSPQPQVLKQTDFGSQADLPTIEHTGNSNKSDIINPASQDMSSSQNQHERIQQANYNPDDFITPRETRGQHSLDTKPLVTPQRRGSVAQGITHQRRHSSVLTANSKMQEKLVQEQPQSFTVIDDQVIQITKGVLPRHKIKLNQKQAVIEQARQRYTTLKVKEKTLPSQFQLGAAGPKQSYYANGQSSLQSVAMMQKSLTTRNSRNRRQLSENGKFFIFNDVKNWKENMVKHSTLGQLSVSNKWQLKNSLESRTMAPAQDQ